jgi:hypothetical protein
MALSVAIALLTSILTLGERWAKYDNQTTPSIVILFAHPTTTYDKTQ